MPSKDQALVLFSRVKGWNKRGAIIRQLRRGIKNIDFDGEMYYVSPVSRKKIIRKFENEVCEYNRNQKIGSKIRGIRGGGKIPPGKKNYYSTLDRCNIVRHYSTCREILNPRTRLIKNPRSGRTYTRKSRMGKKLIRTCSK